MSCAQFDNVVCCFEEHRECWYSCLLFVLGN